jgi:hypothetical protein
MIGTDAAQSGGEHSSADVTAARMLEADGRVRDAITLLTRANRDHPSLEYEREIVRLRHSGYDQVATPVPVHPPTSAGSPRYELVDGVPEVQRDGLDADTMRAAIERHGCLLVRGWVDRTAAQQLVDGIDQTFAAYEAWVQASKAQAPAPVSPWFAPFKVAPAYSERGHGGRAFTYATGGVYTVDSPRMLFEVTESFDELGLRRLLTQYMGEEPALSAKKCNLRRAPVHIPGSWHQDGSFIGTDVSSIDVWTALTDCGQDAPGLDVVPRRLQHLLETDAGGVVIPEEVVAAELAATDGPGVVRPEFSVGDTMFFDHWFLHRTASEPTMTHERYALETWFFAPSRYPAREIPLLY